jgi:enoyl-CoA hydratase/carnithine racemase
MKTVTISGPGKNALSQKLMSSLLDEIRAASGQPILLTGSGDAFSAGLHLKELASLDAAGMVRFLDTLEQLVDTLYNYAGPTVAIINGHAIAGGCVLALACDLRLALASRTALIGLNEVPLGLHFPPRTWRLVTGRLSPHARDRIVLQGGLHDPEAALRLGLVDDVVVDANAAHRLAEAFVGTPLEAYGAAKRALRAGVLETTPEEERHYRTEVLPTWTRPELKERLAAMLRK